MLSSHVIQSGIEELRVITKMELCVMDLRGTVVAGSWEKMSMSEETIKNFLDSPADSQVIGDCHLFKVMDEQEPVYLVMTKGSEDAYAVGRIAVSQIRQLLTAYKEKYDRDSFLQNLILDNLLLVDIYNRAKKLHIPIEGDKVVFLIETEGENDGELMELLKGLFTVQNRDYVIAVEERNIILIKSVTEAKGYEGLRNVADMMVDMINTEAMVNVKVAYGTIVHELKDVSKSFKEAKMALEVGKIFYAEKHVIAYNTLGIGRLIYQLPASLCKLFIDEIFGSSEMPEEIDDEILTTVQKFFENNLNISETSRQLYIHRNTLVYRIEKLQKITGLDMRVFEDALTFNIALMVVNYMKYMESMS